MKASYLLAAAGFAFTAYPGINSYLTVGETYAKIEQAAGRKLAGADHRIAARLSWQIAQEEGRVERNRSVGLTDTMALSSERLRGAGIAPDHELVQTAVAALSLQIDR